MRRVADLVWRLRTHTSCGWLSATWDSVRRRVLGYPIWERYGIAGLILLASWLDFIQLGADGAINTYYAAAVQSMLTGWRAFFFASFDPQGFVSVDKPPLGLWLQTLSAKLFGFNVASLILPEALAGVLSVALLYHLVRRAFGGVAGLLAGALLAISPINIVSNRDNIFESLLVLTTLCATWAALRATETGAFRWLAFCGVFIGLGFNIKMLEAYLVLPACVLVYLLCAPGSWRRRLAMLVGLAGVVSVASFWWITAVDLTPAAQRPYVDSTLTNSELDLAFNYNGLQRLFGQPHYSGATQHALSDAGAPSLFRLLQPHLGGQISWFLPLALVGLFSSIWAFSARSAAPGLRGWGALAAHRQLVLWATWLGVAGAFFTVAQFYNRYYLVMVAPAICALAAVGVVGLWRDYWRPGWRGWLLPLAILSTAIEQGVILTSVSGWNPWLSPVLSVVVAVVVALLVARTVVGWLPGVGGVSFAGGRSRARWMGGAVLLAMAALLIAPLCWLGASFGAGAEGGFPISGPVPAASDSSSAVDPRLIAYLEAHARDLPFVVATVRATDAAPISLATGDAALAMGGYSGYDPILTPASLAAMVRRGEVRFFLLPATNLSTVAVQALYPASIATFLTSYTNRLTRWVSQTCAPTPPAAWKTNTALSAMQLFDCADVAVAVHSSPTSP